MNGVSLNGLGSPVVTSGKLGRSKSTSELQQYATKLFSIAVYVFSQNEEFISIKIEDNGLGIKKEEIPHLFDRFFRSENVRNKDIDGSGIGLSIAKVISDSLKYKLKVDSEYGKWTMFEIIIPINVD